MCYPLLIVAAIAAAATVAGGIQQKQAANAAADVEKDNANIARQQASSEASRARLQVDKVLGAQRASLASSGLGSTGTALDLGEDSARAGALDVATLIYGGTTRSFSHMTAARQLEFQGKQAFQSSLVQAGVSFLSTAFGGGMGGAAAGAKAPALSMGPRTPTWHAQAGI
jgi:outer membrane murein-binding lipoprotein Lpp